MTKKGTAKLSKGIRKFVMIVSDKNFPKNPMQFQPNQEVEAKKQEKTNSAILPRGGTAFTLPDENLIKSVKPESVKNLELCRNAIFDRPISEKIYSSILPDENLTKSMKPEPVKGVELCRICYLNVLAKRAEAA